MLQAMFVVLFVTLLSVSNGFRLQSIPSARSALKMAGDELVGASIEAGGKVFDPLGILEVHKNNPNVWPHPKWWRAFASQYGLTIPGYTAVADPVENLNQYFTNYPLGFAQIIVAIGIIEGHFYPGEFWKGRGSREAGDLGYDPLGFSKGKSAEQKKDLQLKELKNGRLAMIALAAYTSEHWLPGSVPFIPGKF